MQPIKTALLSFGMSGRVFHAPFINLHKGFQLVGSWERANKNIQQFYPEVKSYPSLESVLSDNEIELVIINTPTYTHYDYAKKALLAGKHVVIEKAVTTTLNEAMDLKKIAEKQNKKIAVFQNRRWDSDFKTAQKIIQEGLIRLGNDGFEDVTNKRWLAQVHIQMKISLQDTKTQSFKFYKIRLVNILYFFVP